MKRLLSAIAFLVILCGVWVSSVSDRVTAFVQDELTSPRLIALKKALEAGNRTALESFWQEITRTGAPLVEPIAGDDRNVLLTFLWRAKEETRNVVVFGGVAGQELVRIR